MTNVMLFGVQPNFMEAMMTDYLDVHWQSDSKLSISEQLYTKKGLQSVGMG